MTTAYAEGAIHNVWCLPKVIYAVEVVGVPTSNGFSLAEGAALLLIGTEVGSAVIPAEFTWSPEDRIGDRVGDIRVTIEDGEYIDVPCYATVMGSSASDNVAVDGADTPHSVCFMGVTLYYDAYLSGVWGSYVYTRDGTRGQSIAWDYAGTPPGWKYPDGTPIPRGVLGSDCAPPA